MVLERKVLIRSGGDLASAVIQKFYRAGFKVVVSELDQPKMVRRTVSFSNAIYEGTMIVEGIKAKYVKDLGNINTCHQEDMVPVLTIKEEEIANYFKPHIFIDATLSKQPVNYHKGDYPIMIGLGPDIEAGKNVDVVIETCRGHHLGRLIFNGFAIPNTSVPGFIDGFGRERVLRAPADGIVVCNKEIGDYVHAGDIIMTISDQPVFSRIEGIIRGLIKPGIAVHKGLKVGDVDPRGDKSYCYSISDKGRNIAGGALEAALMLLNGEVL